MSDRLYAEWRPPDDVPPPEPPPEMPPEPETPPPQPPQEIPPGPEEVPTPPPESDRAPAQPRDTGARYSRKKSSTTGLSCRRASFLS